jgi:hypothetical protein
VDAPGMPSARPRAGYYRGSVGHFKPARDRRMGGKGESGGAARDGRGLQSVAQVFALPLRSGCGRDFLVAEGLAGADISRAFGPTGPPPEKRVDIPREGAEPHEEKNSH